MTAGQITKVNADGVIENASNTDTEVADAVSKRHEQNTDTHLGTVDQDISLNSHKLTNVTDPTEAQDAATKSYTDSAIDSIRTACITYLIDGGGSVISTGIAGALRIPFACVIKSVSMGAPKESGSIVIDIWKSTHAGFPPTDANSITASAPPTISSAQKSEDTTLTGWTTTINAGDWLVFNVDSCSSITNVTIALEVEKT